MKSQTNLVRRGSVYYFRARIPADLVAHYGKKEIVTSLRTTDKAVALHKIRIERLQLDQEFSQRRALQHSSPVDLTDVEIDRLAALWLSHLLEEDEEYRIEGMSESQFNDHLDTTDWMEQHYADCLARGKLPEEDFEMEDFIESHGIKVSRGSETYRRLAYAFLKTSRKAEGHIRARNLGEAVDTPKADPMIIRSLAPGNKQTLDSLVAYWKTQADRKPRTTMEVETVISRFIEVNSNLPTSEIKKSHVVAFKDRMLEEGKASATVRKYLGLLSAVIELAVTNDKLQLNPARGVKVARTKSIQKSRIPFSIEDLVKLFSSPIYTSGLRPRGGSGDAAFWIPLIALWSGARLEEIGQLDVADIAEDQGVTFINITEDATSGKSLKTSSSRRRVPIHAMLVKYGLLEYVEAMKTQGHTRLFPLLSSGKGRQLTASWSQWFSRYLRDTVDITDGRKVFHSFRHGFKDACRDSGIAKEIHDRLTGHATGDVGDSYGGESFPIQPLARAMAMLDYTGLHLTHLETK